MTIFPLLSVLQDFTCCHQTYKYSRPWSTQPGEPPFVSWNHAHLGEPPNLMGFTRFVTATCSHKIHSRGAAVCGRWLSPKLTNWCSLRPCRSHTSTTMRLDFFSKICSTCLVIFTHLDHFLRELSFFDLQCVRRLSICQLAIRLHTKH